MRKTLHVLGRTLFGGYFVYNAINHFRNSDQLSGYAASKGVKAPDLAVLASGGLLAIGGTSVLLGYKPRLGLAALMAFLVPVSMQMHDFWEAQDPQQKMNDMIHFAKNMALVGAALTMMELPERWPVSVESESTGRASYPRLAAADMRSLPA